MMENIKDPYHPGLLHTWFVTFGLWRADQSSRMVMDAEGRHAVMISQRNAGGEAKAVTEGVTSFKKDMALNDRRLLDVVRSEEHTSELQSLLRSSYAVFCLKKKKQQNTAQNKPES